MALIDKIFLMALLSLGPYVWLQSVYLWTRPHLQFFPLAWCAFAYLVATRTQIATTEVSLRRFSAILGAFLSLLVALAAIYFSSPWMAYVAAVLVISSWMLLRLSDTRWTTVLAITSVLWITVPLPLGYDGKLIELLQAKSSVAASFVLDSFGILHVREGNILELACKRLFVDEACSGIDSLYALMAICLSVVVWFRQPFIVGILSLSLVPVWASMSNIVRLVSIAVGLDRLNIDLSHGTPHTLLGLVVFAGAFFVDFCFIQFAGANYQARLTRLAGSRPRKSIERKTSTAVRSEIGIAVPKETRRWTFENLAVGVFGMGMLALGIYSLWALQTKSIHRLPQFDSVTLAKLADASKIPKNLDQAVFVDFQVAERNMDSAFGQHSHIWTYRCPDGIFTLSSDFPFRGFHALHQCYQSSGWSLGAEPRQIDLKIGNASEGKQQKFIAAQEIDLKKPNGEYAYLLYALFTLDGEQQTSQANGNKRLERLQQTILEPVTFQIQLFIQTPDKLGPGSRERLRGEFATALPALKESFAFLNP